MTTTTPFSQNPWQPVALTSSFVSRPCFLTSLAMAWNTSPAPYVWQPVPAQTVMIGLAWSLRDRMSFLRLSNCSGDDNLVDIFRDSLYSVNDMLKLRGRRVAVVLPVHHHDWPQGATAEAVDRAEAE